jgi:hypothetical protein
MDTERQRAETLLKAVQKKLWVPDPVGAEFMVGAHLMACDRTTPEAICYHGEDCDGVTSLLGACLLSVGIYVAVVGHAYGGSSSIGHVLCAAWVDGQWEYADPSTDLALGKCVRFSRERLISVPNVKVICDANVCLRERTDYHPEKNDFVVKGVFVGVDGPPVRSPGFHWNACPKVIGLGVEQTPEQAGYDAAYAELAKDPGSAGSEEVLKTAGGAAAAAACAAAGAPVASPLCAAIGSALVGEIIAFVNGLSNAGALPPNAPYNEGFHLAELHNRLFPKEKRWGFWEGTTELKRVSRLPTSPVLIEDQGVRLRGFSGQFGQLLPWPPVFTGLSPEELKFASYVRPVYRQTEARLVARRADELTRVQVRALPKQQPKSSSSVVPILVVGGVVGGLWWWGTR